jgi:hypothetical protein
LLVIKLRCIRSERERERESIKNEPPLSRFLSSFAFCLSLLLREEDLFFFEERKNPLSLFIKRSKGNNPLIAVLSAKLRYHRDYSKAVRIHFSRSRVRAREEIR